MHIAYSALSLFYSLCRFKNHRCIELVIRKTLKNGKRLVAYRYSLRRARFAKYRFRNLHILHFRCFIPSVGLKIITASSCIYEKRQRIRFRFRFGIRFIRLSQERDLTIVILDRFTLRRARFAKYRFSNLHILHSLFRLLNEGNLTVVVLDMFISVQIYRFAKYGKLESLY